MKRNQVVKRIAKILNTDFDTIHRQLRCVGDYDTQYRVVTTNDIEEIAKGLVCRDWCLKSHTNFTPYLIIKEEIIKSIPCTYQGTDFRRFALGKKQSLLKKAWFDINKPVVYIKHTTVMSHYDRRRDESEYVVYIYKPPAKLIEGELKYFDVKRQTNFHLKFWDAVKPGR